MDGNILGIDFTQIEDIGTNVDDLLVTDFMFIFVESNAINLDILGNQRDLSSAIDIGPFEQNRK